MKEKLVETQRSDGYAERCLNWGRRPEIDSKFMQETEVVCLSGGRKWLVAEH